MTARALLISVVLGIAGTLAFVVGVVVDPAAAAHAWMAAWAFALLIALGSLLFLLDRPRVECAVAHRPPARQ